jgi:hypothetical protein
MSSAMMMRMLGFPAAAAGDGWGVRRAEARERRRAANGFTGGMMSAGDAGGESALAQD